MHFECNGNLSLYRMYYCQGNERKKNTVEIVRLGIRNNYFYKERHSFLLYSECKFYSNSLLNLL